MIGVYLYFVNKNTFTFGHYWDFKGVCNKKKTLFVDLAITEMQGSLNWN